MSENQHAKRGALDVADTPQCMEQTGRTQLKRDLTGLSVQGQMEALRPPRPVGLGVVQRKDAEGAEPEGTHGIARSGFSGVSGTLPHLDRIRHSFGSHNVSQTKSFVGGPAKAASERLGATAYASGDSVAFKESPNLHTAAHEAAHVVQQRHGISVPGGVGQGGDRHEAHADRVADLTVQGKSAQALLDALPNSGSPGSAVQREGEDPTQWEAQFNDTYSSFDDYYERFQSGAELTFYENAEEEEQPTVGESLLSIAGQMAIGALLGGIGGFVLARVVSRTATAMTQALWRAAVDAGKDGFKTGIRATYAAASGSGDHQALVAFTGQMVDSAQEGTIEARQEFNHSAGTKDDQQVTIADMRELQEGNDAAREQARTKTTEACIAGWLNLLAGPGPYWATNLEDTSHRGILGIVFSGRNSEPTRILSANCEGINDDLRGFMSNTPLSDWVRPESRDDSTYGHLPIAGLTVDLVARTGDPTDSSERFQVTRELYNLMVADDAADRPGWLSSNPENNRAIYFAIGMNREGYIVHDTDASWVNDRNYNAEAGRYFIEEWSSPERVIQALLPLTLPNVTG